MKITETKCLLMSLVMMGIIYLAQDFIAAPFIFYTIAALVMIGSVIVKTSHIPSDEGCRILFMFVCVIFAIMPVFFSAGFLFHWFDVTENSQKLVLSLGIFTAILYFMITLPKRVEVDDFRWHG